MSFGDERFIGGSVPRVAVLEAAEFLRTYRGRSPVVVAAGAAHTRAVRLWEPEYLAQRCGSAPLELLVGVYEPGAIARRYAGESVRRTDLAAFVRDLAAGRSGAGYLFNSDEAVFRVNEADAELRVGRARAANPHLAPLAADFELPGFVDARDLLYCALFVGGTRDKSPLHYDLGGEAKVLVQIRGKKRALLFPPDQARSFYLRGLFEAPHFPHDHTFVGRVDLRAPDFASFPELAHARGLEALLEPGDLLYWPPFWFHDFTNLDDPTFAAVAVLEELRPPALLLREVLDGFGRQLVAHYRSHGAAPPEELVRAFRELDRLVLSEENVKRRSLWSWIDSTHGSER